MLEKERYVTSRSNRGNNMVCILLSGPSYRPVKGRSGFSRETVVSYH